MTPVAALQALPPEPPKPITHDVTITTTKKLAQAKVLGVPPEEFGIERGARNIETCNYAFHEVVTKTVAQLITEGFDKEQVKALTEYDGLSETETISRDTVAEHLFTTGGASTNDAARPVKITEHYVRMDYEGNGKPCLYMVVTGGDQGEILKKDGKPCIDAIDVIPFAATTAVPQTHRFFGRSMADVVMEIQRIKTALLRAALDSKYLSAGADVEVSEAHAGVNTIDDLLSPKRPGRIVRTKQPGGLNYQEVPDTSQTSFEALSYMDALLETRTGLAKQSQGLDANALQNQSATAVAQVFSVSQMRVKLIARIMAEGVKDIFALLHHTIRSHGQQAQTVRLRGTWVDVDPRNWKTRDDMTINVGLGTGGKAQQFAQAMAIGNFQKELLMGGKANLVDDKALYNTGAELIKIMGHKNPDKFLNDPSAKDPQTGQLLHPPLPPPPDPKVQAAQVKAQTDQQAASQKAQLDQQKAQNDALHQQIKAQADIEVAKVKAELDAKIAIIETHMKAVEAEQKMRHAEMEHHASMAETKLGMVATAQSHDQKSEQGQQAHQAKVEQMQMTPKNARTKLKSETKLKAAQVHSQATKQMADKMDANTQALLAAVKELARPKKVVRDGKTNRVTGIE